MVLKLGKWCLHAEKKNVSKSRRKWPYPRPITLKIQKPSKTGHPLKLTNKGSQFQNKCIILKPGSEKTQPLQLALWIRRLSASVSFTKMSKFSTSSFSIAFLKGSGRSFNHLVKFLPIVLNVFQLFQQDSARWLGILEWSPGWNWWNLPVGQWRYRMNHPP